jgi:hypothetical protein
MGKKKNKPKYHPFETLAPRKFDPIFEASTAELFTMATKGSQPIWSQLKSTQGRLSPKLRQEFFSLAHDGMRKAQAKIVETMISDQPWPDANSLLLHGIADSMAWQLIGNQLCYARRLYKEQPIVNLKHSNFDSILRTVNHHHKTNPNSFSLISDLTTFVQVGDLLSAHQDGTISISEVKEGEKNHQILEFMKFYTKTGCPRSIHYFTQEHGPQSLKQMQRIARQASRMGHVAEILNTGTSQDPDTQHRIKIPEETVFMEDWDAELNYILNESDFKGWALTTVDGCLFIASYSRTAMNGAGFLAFNSWFDRFGGTPGCPRARLIDCMSHPLALPIFNRNIADRHKLDILFGRKNVCMALNIPKLFERLEKCGIGIREASNKEASEMDQKGFPPYRHERKAYFLGTPGNEMLLLDGIFLRILFHSQRPLDTIKSILKATALRPPAAF